jgi:hypothetical protein
LGAFTIPGKQANKTTSLSLTQRTDPQVEARPGDLCPVNVGPPERSKSAAHRPRLGVHYHAGLGPLARLAVLAAAGTAARAVVEQYGDVDAHDGNNAAHVQVHHEDALEGERTDVVVHDLSEAEGQHEEDEELAIEGAQGHPKVGTEIMERSQRHVPNFGSR